ncbi:MAG: hypothetical protein HZR80_10970 [Candidatus Heimdallarchaeota archaeon]
MNDLNASISIDFLKLGFYFIKIEETGNDAEIDDYSIMVTATEVYDP